MKGDAKVKAFLAANREKCALERQLNAIANPAERERWLAHWGRDLHEARNRLKLAHGKLTGGELARARAITLTELRAAEANEETTT